MKKELSWRVLWRARREGTLAWLDFLFLAFSRLVGGTGSRASQKETLVVMHWGAMEDLIFLRYLKEAIEALKTEASQKICLFYLEDEKLKGQPAVWVSHLFPDWDQVACSAERRSNKKSLPRKVTLWKALLRFFLAGRKLHYRTLLMFRPPHTRQYHYLELLALALRPSRLLIGFPPQVGDKTERFLSFFAQHFTYQPTFSLASIEDCFFFGCGQEAFAYHPLCEYFYQLSLFSGTRIKPTPIAHVTLREQEGDGERHERASLQETSRSRVGNVRAEKKQKIALIPSHRPEKNRLIFHNLMGLAHNLSIQNFEVVFLKCHDGWSNFETRLIEYALQDRAGFDLEENLPTDYEFVELASGRAFLTFLQGVDMVVGHNSFLLHYALLSPTLVFALERQDHTDQRPALAQSLKWSVPWVTPYPPGMLGERFRICEMKTWHFTSVNPAVLEGIAREIQDFLETQTRPTQAEEAQAEEAQAEKIRTGMKTP